MIERHKIDIASEYCQGIFQNHPRWPTTFGACSNKCGNTGRGSGKCADCFEKDLSGLVGKEMAHKFHQSVKDTTALWFDIYEKLDD